MKKTYVSPAFEELSLSTEKILHTSAEDYDMEENYDDL